MYRKRGTMVANKYIDVVSHNSKAVLPKDYKFNKIQQSPKVLQIVDGMLGFEFNGTYIVDPTLDETGRFPVSATTYYKISAKDRNRMIKANIKI
jgi:hypothetical protein